MTAAVSVNPDRKRIGSVADVGQAISLAAPGLLLLALPATALLGCWSRIVVGAARTYFPSAAWGLGPSLLWEYPEPLRSIDSNRGARVGAGARVRGHRRRDRQPGSGLDRSCDGE